MTLAICASLPRLAGSTGGSPSILAKPMRSEKQQILASEPPPTRSKFPSTFTPMSYPHTAPLKLAVIGDVHDHWDDDSATALSSLNADIAIFVGDFGNENAEIVKKIASHSAKNKIFMLGNHEAWYSLTARGRQRALKVAMQSSSLSSSNIVSTTMSGPVGTSLALEEMFRTLGKDHIGYSSTIFDQFGIALVGGRPFSKGGKRWSDIAAFYKHHYGIESMEESALRIVDIALSQPFELPLILVAHNGPTGLGNKRYSPCGVDWQEPEEDFGDPDLGEAIELLATQNRPPSLVLFGHMHHNLKNGGKRDMAAVDPVTGTVYLNSAVVPRIRRFDTTLGGSNSGTRASISGIVKGHHFLIVEMEQGVVSAAKHIWAGVENNTKVSVLAEEEVVKSVAAGDGSGRRVVSYYKANCDEWTPVILEGSAPMPLTE
ncbi:hypothetical protein Ndes2437B_g08078 [Nannochloris sp. 'desiccata']